MTPKIKERWVNTGLAVLSGAVVAFLAFFLSSSEGRTIRINDKLEEKAPYEYVDDHDAIVQKNLDDYKDDHQIQHSVEMQSVDDRLRLIMDFWNIEDKKDEGRGD